MPVSPGTGADLASEACMRSAAESITLEQLQHHLQNCRLIPSISTSLKPIIAAGQGFTPPCKMCVSAASPPQQEERGTPKGIG
ncbi:hypothetical protein SRHO_G00001280 [Serrasalmus rhombeus]